MNWREARDLLDGKGKRRGSRDTLKIARNTYLERGPEFRPGLTFGWYAAGGRDAYPGNAIGIRFHETYVAILTPHWTELYTGGWHTKTTAERMSCANVTVGGGRGGWIVLLCGGGGWASGGHPYFDGIRVSADGTRLMTTQPHKPREWSPVTTVSGWA